MPFPSVDLSGALADEAAIRAIGEIARTRGAHVLVDEVYLDSADAAIPVAATYDDTGVVTFDQTADTFIRDVRFTADRNRLIGEVTMGHQIVDLVLTKAE